MSRMTNIITGLIWLALVATFVLGISTGFAGFKGGLPFMIIAIFVPLLAACNVWEDAIRKKK